MPMIRQSQQSQSLLVKLSSAGATAVAKSGESRPLESVMCSDTSESAPAESAGDEDEAGSLWSRTMGTTSVDATTAEKPAGEAMPPEFVMCSARSDLELEESCDEELTHLEQEELRQLQELARNGRLVESRHAAFLRRSAVRPSC